MLVYCSSLALDPVGGAQDVIRQIAVWVGKRCRSFIDPERLGHGIRDFNIAGKYHIQSRVSVDDDNSPVYPFLFCAQLSHADEQVSGRRWVMEVGLQQDTPDSEIICTFLLKTDEVSARVTTPIQVTRPRLVQDIVEHCNPSNYTPGLRVKRLDEKSAAAFLIEVEREERSYPIVIISPLRDGKYLVAPERIRSLLIGIADVVAIQQGANTYKIEDILGRRYAAWRGAINIVFKPRRGGKPSYCESILLHPDDLNNLLEEGKSIESEVLAIITHRTNLPCSWQHISLDVVNRKILRRQLGKSIERAKQNNETAEYVALLEEADRELQEKDNEVAILRSDLEETTVEARKLQADIDGLKYALSGRESSTDENTDEVEAITPLREAISAVFKDDPSLEQSLTIISALFPDRVVVLESAYSSARDSIQFRYGSKAFKLLWNLAIGYWEALASGLGDGQAKDVFGHNAFAANESEVLSAAGKSRRTFHYRGRDIEMQKHLKIGVKDSVAETLRVHFEWLSDEQRIVIGYCGKHLDF
ncbi:hypothetical protein [Thiolapillus sp.]|uniref:hypothetical protein n=1 Tax=Thiolapillus sp. TaxID=2017437 RepID=UPI0025CDE44F|nr:hypothetical protein [Thiolapillus sp.]